MISSELWAYIDSRLGETWWFLKKTFAGYSVLTVVDLLQLHPVREKLIFSQFSDKDSMKYLLVSQLCHLFKYTELTKVVNQNDKLFVNFLNEVQVGNHW